MCNPQDMTLEQLTKALRKVVDPEAHPLLDELERRLASEYTSTMVAALTEDHRPLSVLPPTDLVNVRDGEVVVLVVSIPQTDLEAWGNPESWYSPKGHLVASRKRYDGVFHRGGGHVIPEAWILGYIRTAHSYSPVCRDGAIVTIRQLRKTITALEERAAQRNVEIDALGYIWGTSATLGQFREQPEVPEVTAEMIDTVLWLAYKIIKRGPNTQRLSEITKAISDRATNRAKYLEQIGMTERAASLRSLVHDLRGVTHD